MGTIYHKIIEAEKDSAGIVLLSLIMFSCSFGYCVVLAEMANETTLCACSLEITLKGTTFLLLSKEPFTSRLN